MGFGDLLQDRKMGSTTIIKGNIDGNVSIMPILLKVVTIVKFSGENYERVVDMKIRSANALWEIF